MGGIAMYTNQVPSAIGDKLIKKTLTLLIGEIQKWNWFILKPPI